jgi:hypothetical protein
MGNSLLVSSTYGERIGGARAAHEVAEASLGVQMTVSDRRYARATWIEQSGR